jgi:hypothetical protein
MSKEKSTNKSERKMDKSEKKKSEETVDHMEDETTLIRGDGNNFFIYNL